MQHITYSPVDAQFRRLERDLPADAPFNRTDPIDGITFGFALESRYPLPAGDPAIYYGTVEGEVTDDPSILLRKITVEEYDAAYAAEMKAREPVPPPPIVLTVGLFVSRFLIPQEDALFADLDDAMNAESRLVRRNWLNDRYEFTESDPFWLIVSGHLDALGVTAGRKGELMARPVGTASFAAVPTDEAVAA